MIKLINLLKANEPSFVLILALQDSLKAIKTDYLLTHNNNLIKLINCLNNTIHSQASR